MIRHLLVLTFTAMVSVSGVGAQGSAAPTAPSPSPAPPPPTVAIHAPVPPANAVALCNDDTFVVAPAPATDCSLASRGGVKLMMPAMRVTPVRAVAPAAESRVEESATASNAAPPAGSTMRCKDGTYLSGPPSAVRCDANGGTAVIFTAPAVAPAPPRPR